MARVSEWESASFAKILVPSFCLTFRHFLDIGNSIITTGNPKVSQYFRELIPPITAFLEEDLKLVHTGGNLTPGDGVGSRRSFRTPTQKLTLVKPRCHLVTWLTSRISPNKTPEKSYFNIFVSRWQAFQTLRHPPSCLLQTFVIITTTQQLVRNIFIGWLYFYQPMRIMLVEPLSTKHKMVMAESLKCFAPGLEILELWRTGAIFG